MVVYDVEDLYQKLGLLGNFQIFVVVMYTIGERITAGLLDFQVLLFCVFEISDFNTFSNMLITAMTFNSLLDTFILFLHVLLSVDCASLKIEVQISRNSESKRNRTSNACKNGFPAGWRLKTSHY